ncbi:MULTISPECIES: hypothetical protein [unclassified Nocardiopsis]|uniref:hypothetical protein n=1 Tax=unclassified Nocardiopsis TaxID=2649073 RepID=UPI001A8F70CE|nr:hypothetical protein [Nocardiopsis sp. TSRI0078]
MDATEVRTGGIDSCSRYFPQAEVLLDNGCLGLRRDRPDRFRTPPREPNKSALPDVHERWEYHRHAHSSNRVTVEHALADRKRWRQLTRWTHRRENLPAAYRSIAGSASDRTANI